jgi:hypothetical protein
MKGGFFLLAVRSSGILNFFAVKVIINFSHLGGKKKKKKLSQKDTILSTVIQPPPMSGINNELPPTSAGGQNDLEIFGL